MGFLFPVLLTQEQLSLSTSNILKFVCTVIRIDKFYAWIILLIEGIDLFNASVNHAE